MGWESRGWARWTDAERSRFYGSTARRAENPHRRSSAVFWTVLVIASVAVIVWVTATGADGTVPPPIPVRWGEAGVLPMGGPSDTSGLPPNAPGGSNTRCTAKQIDPATGQWRCTNYVILGIP